MSSGASPYRRQSTPPSSPPSTGDDDGTGEVHKKPRVGDGEGGGEEAAPADGDDQNAAQQQQWVEERKEDIAGGQEQMDKKFKALEYLLSQSKLYSSIITERMQQHANVGSEKEKKERVKDQRSEVTGEAPSRHVIRRSTRSTGAVDSNASPSKSTALPSRQKAAKKRRNRDSDIAAYFDSSRMKGETDTSNDTTEGLEKPIEDREAIEPTETGDQATSSRQPKSVTGGIMRSYQLDGLEWMASLYENGLNGILADEMGLGKTIQTISFLAFLREQGISGPFLVVAPLSTTQNWVNEFEKWTPNIPVILYHGSKIERAVIRKDKLRNPRSPAFPIVITSYEISMRDRKYLSHYGWKFIIIDEGHRLKNLNCRLIRDLQAYESANRLLLTGTPLQNNLAELWSLLHFLMPMVFDKLSSFESWFDFSGLSSRYGIEELLSSEKQSKLVESLHAILKPFLLRRIKRDVEASLPRKREYTIYAPLTPFQRLLYSSVVSGDLRNFLHRRISEVLGIVKSQPSTNGAKRKHSVTDDEPTTGQKSAKASRASTPHHNRKRAVKTGKSFEEVDDDEYFQQLFETRDSSPEKASVRAASKTGGDRSPQQLVELHLRAKKLQNPLMQLRLCCNSPYNFFAPWDILETEPDERIVNDSGKMLLLDALLPKLFAKNHKVLIFSQFKTQLDLIELYACNLRGWNICRIDGGTSLEERQIVINQFNTPPSKGKKDASPNLFLLTTRAGGQGINLVAADTVILFDSDWNPAQDAQAQDRAHRIGQTKNVIVYRFATRDTVEQAMLDSADTKKRLERIVVRKGGLVRSAIKSENGAFAKTASDGAPEGGVALELRKLLQSAESESFDADVLTASEGRYGSILSDKDIAILTDRSEEAYDRAEQGLDNSTLFSAKERKVEGFLESLK